MIIMQRTIRDKQKSFFLSFFLSFFIFVFLFFFLSIISSPDAFVS